MRTATVFLFAVGLAVAAPVPKALNAKKSDAELLEGKWASVTLDGGQGHQPNTTYWLEVKGGKLSTGSGGQASGFKQVSFALDPTQSPKHLDVLCGSGTQAYIYEIDGDTLTWCNSMTDGKRPTGMKSARPYCCTLWKRVKE